MAYEESFQNPVNVILCITFFNHPEEDPDHIFSSDSVLLAISGGPSVNTSWLTCASNECSFSKDQSQENVFTHEKRVFHIYANGRFTVGDPIRYGDEVALFYKQDDDGFGLWLSCTSDLKQCWLGTCPGFPHFKHWMWNTESCYENRFIIHREEAIQNDSNGGRYPVKEGDQIHLIGKLDKIKSSRKASTEKDHSIKMIGGAISPGDSFSLIIQKGK